MKVVVQRVREAQVSIDGHVHSKIFKGLLVLLGVGHGDASSKVEYLTDKLIKLRIFPDEAGKMNLNVTEAQGDILVVSQFTLYGDTRKGNRPSFVNAAPPALAEKLYEEFVSTLSRKLQKEIPTGKFAADMQVSLINDGPVTIVIDTKDT